MEVIVINNGRHESAYHYFTVTNGKDGLTPFIGENGNWWIGEKDTGVKAAADDSVPVGSGNVLLAILVLKKKKSLV